MAMPLKNFVKTRLESLGRTPAEATEKGGLSRTFIYDLLSGPDTRSVTGQNLKKLAEALDLSAPQLMQALEEGNAVPDGGAPLVASPPDEVRLAPVPVPPAHAMRKDVPVMGTAMGSVFENVEGFTFEGGPIDYVRRPPALEGIKGLYAIYIVNDSMYPMHPAGEIRFVNPHKPPHIGGTVIVQTRKHDDDPGQAYIKILRKRTPDKVYLEQFNPSATIEIPTKVIRSMHHVYTMNEMFGV